MSINDDLFEGGASNDDLDDLFGLSDKIDSMNLNQEDDIFGDLKNTENITMNTTIDDNNLGYSDDLFGNLGNIDSDVGSVDEILNSSSGNFIIPDYVFDDGVDNVNFESKGTKKDNVVHFDNKFYVGYLGITPLVILKEKPEVLLSLLKLYPDKIKLMNLNNNIYGNLLERKLSNGKKKMKKVEGFYENMLLRYRAYSVQDVTIWNEVGITPTRVWSDEDILIADNIIKTFEDNFGKIIEVIQMINFKYMSISITKELENIIFSTNKNIRDILEISNRYDNSIKLIDYLAFQDTSPDLLLHIINSFKILEDSITKSNINVNISLINKLEKKAVSDIFSDEENMNMYNLFMEKIKQLSNNYAITSVFEAEEQINLSDEVENIVNAGSDYWNRDYYYTNKEFEILKDLGFPVSIAGYEHYFKNKVEMAKSAAKGRIVSANVQLYENIMRKPLFIVYSITKYLLNMKQESMNIPKTIMLF